MTTPYVNILTGVQDFCWPKIINQLGQKPPALEKNGFLNFSFKRYTNLHLFTELIFLNEIFFWKKSVFVWHQELSLKVQFWHCLMNPNSSSDLKKNKIPLRRLILGQKFCFLEPTIFEIPQPKWHCICRPVYVLKVSKSRKQFMVS